MPPPPCVAGNTTVKELHDKNREKVTTLIDLVNSSGGQWPPKKLVSSDSDVDFDDLFVLRYILSHKTPEKAVEPLKKCLAWRLENAELLKTLSDGGDHPLASQVRRYQISGQCGTLGNGEPVFVVRLGMCDLRSLMNLFSIEQTAEFLLFEKERIWRECDKQTRIVGKMVKCVTVIDFAGFSMFGNKSDNRFFKALGKSSKLSSLYYPQLQIKTVSINTPAYYSMIHKTMSAVMPKSSMEKMSVCPTKKTNTKIATGCPFLTKYDGVQSVPPFLGGGATCPDSLIAPGERLENADPGGLTNIHIRARSRERISIDILKPNTIVQFSVGVSAHHIMLSAVLEPLDLSEEQTTPRDNGSGSTDGEASSRALLTRGVSSSLHDVNTKASGSLRNVNTKTSGSLRNVKTKTSGSLRDVNTKASSKSLLTRGGNDANNARRNNNNANRRWSLSPALRPQPVRDLDGILKGSWKLAQPGKLHVTFDNGFSILRAKKVAYRLEVVEEPEDAEEKSWWDSHWSEYVSYATGGLERDEEQPGCVVS